ncbi:acylphosphatase [Granulicella cerasi]|uniref:Acylphosphatase n=1 Tax=Granulicella cerasi TaxID=741063 RepID=A0ABW1Z8C5_9BACT|nr:acylphosphatase [Granulicella cerasi]
MIDVLRSVSAIVTVILVQPAALLEPINFAVTMDAANRRVVVLLIMVRLRAVKHSAKLRLGMVLHFLIRGRVQGVGFRWFVHREAAELGLSGWVRNTESGEVEAVASGDAKELAELRKSLRKGSRGSRVDAVIEHELAESEAEGLGPFHIEGAW